MEEIKRINSDLLIEVGEGRFDNHCVYVTENFTRYAPRDTDYFDFLIKMANKYSANKIYADYTKIYDSTDSNINKDILLEITEISDEYDEADEFNKWFSVLYLGMVAEENKLNAVLKKRIKRLGIHQILFESFTSYQAANFSKGKKASALLNECAKRGF